ncbi:MAG: hypothetical protein RRA92_02205 [Gemmatimonadota bacterium]|nr:hypothetical protein [Gemmatimonadota bacterium]
MRMRLLAVLALLAATIPVAPQEAPAKTRFFCRVYCETLNLTCRSAAGLIGSGDELCEPVYEGCMDGCEVPV